MNDQEYSRRERECICEESGVPPERARQIAESQVQRESEPQGEFGFTEEKDA